MVFERAPNFVARGRNQPHAVRRLCHRLPRQQHERIERGRAFPAGNFFDARPGVGRALVDCFRSAREREFEQRRLQLLLLGRVRGVENFCQRRHRVVGRAFLDRELRRQQPANRICAFGFEQRLNRDLRARCFASHDCNRRFVLSIFARQRCELFQLLPKLERVRLAGAGKKSRNCADRLRFGLAELIRSGGFFACLQPVRMVDVSERFRRMPPRLPRFDCTQRRPRCEITDNEQERSRHQENDHAPPFRTLQADFLRRHHEFGIRGHRSAVKSQRTGDRHEMARPKIRRIKV